MNASEDRCRSGQDGETPADAATLVARLEEAGATLMALPQTGYTTRLRMASPDIVRTALEAYGYSERRIRPAVPSAARITRMDAAFAWIALIPVDRYVLRRIVGARSLVDPLSDRHLFSWRQLARVVGADHKAVQRWHAEGIELIVRALAREKPVPASGATAHAAGWRETRNVQRRVV